LIAVRRKASISSLAFADRRLGYSLSKLDSLGEVTGTLQEGVRADWLTDPH
jgi:hypothetical protein